MNFKKLLEIIIDAVLVILFIISLQILVNGSL